MFDSLPGGPSTVSAADYGQLLQGHPRVTADLHLCLVDPSSSHPACLERNEHCSNIVTVPWRMPLLAVAGANIVTCTAGQHGIAALSEIQRSATQSCVDIHLALVRYGPPAPELVSSTHKSCLHKSQWEKQLEHCWNLGEAQKPRAACVVRSRSAGTGGMLKK